jgi:uncharacterized membrane protein HdeD (DUF308 family)
MPSSDTANIEIEFSRPQIATWCLGLGGVLAALGILAIAAPWMASTVIDYLCGGTLIAAGLAQLGMAAGTWTWRGFWLTLVCGALSVVAGAAMLAIPVEGIHALVTFLGIVILLEAAAKLTAALSVPREFPRGWILFNGIITAVLGGILLTSPASQAGLYLGTLIGINLLSSGIASAAAGFTLRRSLS